MGIIFGGDPAKEKNVPVARPESEVGKPAASVQDGEKKVSESEKAVAQEKTLVFEEEAPVKKVVKKKTSKRNVKK